MSDVEVEAQGPTHDAYIGTAPEYQNHANDVDAPYFSEDPVTLEREQLAKEYETSSIVPDPALAPPAEATTPEEPDGEQPDNGEEPELPEDLESATKDQLMAWLDWAEVEYNKSSNKAELIEAVSDNLA